MASSVTTITSTGTFTGTSSSLIPTWASTNAENPAIQTTSYLTLVTVSTYTSTISSTSTIAAVQSSPSSSQQPNSQASSSSTGKSESFSTAPSQTSTPSSPPKLPVRTKINGGAVAGAAIGCLIAGLIIGFLIAFFLAKRKQKRGGYSSTYSPPPATELKAFDSSSRSPAPQLAAMPDKGAIQLNQFLLDAVPDSAIAGELRSLETLIQQHVENNYHRLPVNVGSRALSSSLTQLGVGGTGSLPVEDIVTLALDPKTRHLALQHVISKVVFSSIDVQAWGKLSMFPAPMAAFLQAIPSERNPQASDKHARSLAISRWRALSVFLLHPNRSQRTPLPTSESVMAPQARELANALDTFLSPFAQVHSNQKNHLEAVIIECAKLGYILLSQPADWLWLYQTSERLVLCPGLVKRTDRDGKAFDSVQVVAPKYV